MPFKCGTLRCAIELGRHPGCLSLAHRVISWRRTNSVASGAKRTFSEPRLQNPIYEYAP
jgi:hypothetical protein